MPSNSIPRSIFQQTARNRFGRSGGRELPRLKTAEHLLNIRKQFQVEFRIFQILRGIEASQIIEEGVELVF
jgi:hypothetical protein